MLINVERVIFMKKIKVLIADDIRNLAEHIEKIVLT